MPESFTTSQTEKRADGSTITTTLTITLADDPTPYDGEAEGDFEKAAEPSWYMTFEYDGLVREVQNPQFVKGAWNWRKSEFNALIEGVELTRDGVETNQFKKFSLDKIVPVLSGS